jgi:ketosteroid isomerase-like protein
MLTNLQLARQYISAIADGKTGSALADLFTPDVSITEMPSRISPHGSVAGLAEALAAAERGQRLFARQTYAITNILGDGDWVALELDWTGIAALAFQHLPPGSAIKDKAAIFLQFRAGRIAAQRHYDCFEPW